MKNYVFLTPSISNIGGAENYVYSKTLYLQKKGYNVGIIVYGGTESVLDFTDCKVLTVNEFRFKPAEICKTKRKILIKQAIEFFNIEMNAILESSTLDLGQWGEEIAKEAKCRNFIYSLQENFDVNNYGEYLFLKYKLKRRELVGISKQSVNFMLKNFENIKCDDAYLIAHSLPTISDVPVDEEIIQLINSYNTIIGSIGRTDKIVCSVLLNQISRYSQQKKLKMLLLLIGGPLIGEKEIKLYENKYLKIYCTDYLYPIPLTLVKSLNVNIATAGSADITGRINIPTICLSAKDGTAIGVYNRTTLNVLFPDDNDCIMDLSYWLDQILENNFYEVQAPLQEFVNDDIENIDTLYDDHLSYLKTCCNSRQYFDVLKIQMSYKSICKFVLNFLFGPDVTIRILQIVKK